MIDGVLLTPLSVIHHPKGDIYHAIKSSSPGYQGFGEAYFSTVTKGMVKGWKKHNRLDLNLIVPIGKIEFALHDDREFSSSYRNDLVVTLSIEDNYQRLTIPPGIWVAFRGLSEMNILLNILPEEHDPEETISIALEEIPHLYHILVS